MFGGSGMTEKTNITFLLFTFNEERRIEYMLRCLKGNGEIVLIDNYSEDRTCEIAEKYTENIYRHKNPGHVSDKETMDFALSKVSTDWVYIALADELIPKKLMNILIDLSNQSKYKIVKLYRKNYMYGREVYNYGKHHLRMFKVGSVDFSGNVVHGLGKELVSKGEIIKIRRGEATSIWHFSSYDTSALERSHNRYADIESRERSEYMGQNFSGLRAIWTLVFYFWGTYLGLGGYRGGWVGFFISVQIAYYKFSVEARLYEIDNNIDLGSIEESYDEKKEKLLREFES